MPGLYPLNKAKFLLIFANLILNVHAFKFTDSDRIFTILNTFLIYIVRFQQNGAATAGEDTDGEEVTGKDIENSRETFKAIGGGDKRG